MKSIKLIGGRLCIDFVNTVGWRGRAEREEKLLSYAELADWAGLAGALPRAEARALRAEARARPEAAARTLAAALALREALARLFEDGRGGVAELNDLLARSSLVPSGAGWRGAGDVLERPLWPVIWDAAALLSSEGRAAVRACDDRECGWMFLDRARHRRWCSMEDCGNRAKARRHYARIAVPRARPGRAGD